MVDLKRKKKEIYGKTTTIIEATYHGHADLFECSVTVHTKELKYRSRTRTPFERKMTYKCIKNQILCFELRTNRNAVQLGRYRCK